MIVAVQLCIRLFQQQQITNLLQMQNNQAEVNTYNLLELDSRAFHFSIYTMLLWNLSLLIPLASTKNLCWNKSSEYNHTHGTAIKLL
jgi:nitrate reductase gamma subunit